MAVPKKKTSRSRRDRRRGQPSKRHFAVGNVTCPGCGEPVRPHRMCSKGTDCSLYASGNRKKGDKAAKKPAAAKKASKKA